MKKEPKIARKNLPLTTGFTFYVVWWLVAKTYELPDWVFYAIGTLAILNFVGAVFITNKTEEVDIFKNER